HRRENLHVANQGSRELQILIADDGLDQSDFGGSYESGEGMLEQGLAANAAELLRYLATRSQALPSGHHDSCNKRHTLLLRSRFALPRYSRPANATGKPTVLRMNTFLQCSTCAAPRNG